MKTETVEYTNGKTKFIGQLFWDEARSGLRLGVVEDRSWAAMRALFDEAFK